MRIALLIVVALALVLSASAVWAVGGAQDGYAGLTSPGGSGGTSGSPGSFGNPTTNWVQTSGTSSYVVYWDNDDDTWRTISGSYPGPDLSITCDIELRVACTADNGLYFHVGDTTANVPPGYLSWALEQNHPCWIGISKADWAAGDGTKPDGKATYLAYQKDRWGLPRKDEDVGDGKIPFTVYFSQEGGGAVLTNYSQGAGSWGYWSPGRVAACDHWGYFKIVPEVQRHEADGYYVLDPVLLVAPEL